MTTESILGAAHTALALISLVLGAVVLLLPKGGGRHRWLGRSYVAALAVLNITALSVYKESGHIGPFHVLAIISLATLVSGVAPVILRRPRGRWVEVHAYFMSWSYVGLVAAGVAQFVTMTTDLSGSISVGGSSMVTVLFGWMLINRGVPAALARRRAPFTG